MQDEKVMSVEQIDKHVETTYTPKKLVLKKILQHLTCVLLMQ